MNNRALQTQAYLPELLVAERDNPDLPRLTIAERFEFCIKATVEMAALHARGAYPECLGLHGTTVDATNGQIKVTLGGIKMPKNLKWIADSGYAFDDLFITTSDSNLTDKSSVQLLGFLFLKVFQPMIHGEHLHTYFSIDSASKNTLLELLRMMIHPDPTQRVTLDNSLGILKFLQLSYMRWEYLASPITIKRYNDYKKDYKKLQPYLQHLRALQKGLTEADKQKPLTSSEIQEIEKYAIKLMQEDNAASVASAASAASVASAAVSAAALISTSCTLFAKYISCDDLTASKPVPDNVVLQQSTHSLDNTK